MSSPGAGVLIVLVLGSSLSWISQRMGVPNAVAQVLLGVLLGGAALGWVEHSTLLHVLGEAGILLLLGVAGLKLSLRRLRAAGSTGALVAALGIVFSVAGGYAIGSFYGSPSDEALYLGLVLGATSIGITVQLLEQYGLVGHRVADVLIAAAVIDDVILLFLLGAVHGMLGESFGVREGSIYIVLAVVIPVGVLFVCRSLSRWALRQSYLTSRWRLSVWILTAIGLGALLTDSLGMSSVVGAFFAGLGTSGALSDAVRYRGAKALQPLVLVLMPFYFIMIGVQAQTDILGQPELLWLVSGLVVVAVMAKVLGGVLGALSIVPWNERWLIGFGMVARGEIALVIATLGFEQGHLTRSVYLSVVLMAILLAVLGPVLMTPFAGRLTAQQSTDRAR